MSDRRRATRFVFARPPAARIRVLNDVLIEETSPERLTVLASAPSPKGEEHTMRVRAADGRTATLTVKTVESRAIQGSGSGSLYRLDLEVLDASPDPGPEPR